MIHNQLAKDSSLTHGDVTQGTAISLEKSPKGMAIKVGLGPISSHDNGQLFP